MTRSYKNVMRFEAIMKVVDIFGVGLKVSE